MSVGVGPEQVAVNEAREGSERERLDAEEAELGQECRSRRVSPRPPLHDHHHHRSGHGQVDAEQMDGEPKSEERIEHARDSERAIGGRGFGGELPVVSVAGITGWEKGGWRRAGDLSRRELGRAGLNMEITESTERRRLFGGMVLGDEGLHWVPSRWVFVRVDFRKRCESLS